MARGESTATGVAFARAALVGNPSDGYAGATLALALPERRAEARARLGTGESGPIAPPSALVSAARSRFARECGSATVERTAIRWRTSIPRAVGLGGSSAIVIATIRALCELHGVQLEPREQARIALAVEAEDLGIAAGLQDRVAQAYGGLTFMEFDPERAPGGPLYDPLDRSLLPPLVIAWRTDAGADSGAVHRNLRARYERGDPGVRGSIAELAELARAARTALLHRDAPCFARCVDASFDARARIMELDPRHVELIEHARRAGASANYTGSGGAVAAVCRDASHQAQTRRALSAIPSCATLD